MTTTIDVKRLRAIKSDLDCYRHELRVLAADAHTGRVTGESLFTAANNLNNASTALQSAVLDASAEEADE